MKAPTLPADRADLDRHRLELREVWSRPLPYQHRALTRLLSRSVISLARGYVVEISGVEHVAPAADPFIFASNHNQRLEAVTVPALLLFHRRGKLVHFMADWPTMLVPFAALLLRCGEVIPVTGKSARWRFLNVFKSRFESSRSAFDQAAAKLREGASIGVFPEATMNRDPRRLLRGQSGAARLALRTGAPVVPAGIRFPGHDGRRPIRDLTPMRIEIGAPIHPPAAGPEREATRAFHARVMGEISRLSGKEWHPKAPRRTPCP